MQPPRPTDSEPAARRAEARRRHAFRRRRRIVAALVVAVAAAAVVAVVALRGGDDRERAETAAGTARTGEPAPPDRAGGMRWLVKRGGAPPSIATENEARGTRDWALPPSAHEHGTVEGYVSSQDELPGETVRLYVNAPGARSVRVAVYRIGWYGGLGGRLVAKGGRVPTTPQPRCHHAVSTGLTECDWRHPLSLRLPRSLPSGVYVATMTTDRGAARQALFVVEARHPGPLLTQIPTPTYEAYNGWGGSSLYPSSSPAGPTGTQGVEVSYDRPYDSPSGAGQFFYPRGDVAIVRFLEREGYPVTYTTGASVDRDPGQLRGRALAIDVGHSEYWSPRALGAFRAARDSGTNLAFLSSDTAAWRIRYEPATAASSEAGAPDHRIIAYKEHAAYDPEHRPAGFPGRAASLVGTSYQDCIAPRIPPGDAPEYSLFPWRPAETLRPAWLFRGTGLEAGKKIEGIVGYEVDSIAPASPPGVRLLGSGTVPCMNGKVGTGDTTLYRARSGALVFGSGTLAWELGLSPVPEVSPDAPRRPDPRLIRLTENLVERMLNRRAGGP